MASFITTQLKAIQPEHVRAAIEEVKRNNYPQAHASKTYHLVHEGRSYPQKYIASLATRYATGTQLMPDQFSAHQSLPILEALGFTIHSTENRNANSTERMEIDGELIGELYYYAKVTHEKSVSREGAIAALGIKAATASAYFDDFERMREGALYQRTMNAEATEYFLQHIFQDYGEEGLRLALLSVDKHIKYYDTLGNGSLRQTRMIWEKYSAIAGAGELHAIDGSYTGQSPSFRPSPTNTPIDLNRTNILPNAPLSERDKAFLSDVWKNYSMAGFERKNMDAGNIRRALERGYIEYLSGDAATPQCVFQLTIKARDMLAPEPEEGLFLNEIGTQAEHSEGEMKEAMRSYYKRNPKARADCLAHHGYRCAVCSFDFEKTYGSIGRQFIHVHHENEMALSGGQEYRIDPVKDLKPVCPNCHAMLHRKTPAHSIEELKKMLKS